MLSDERLEEIEKKHAEVVWVIHARTDLPDLLAEVKRLKARLAEAEKVCEAFAKFQVGVEQNSLVENLEGFTSTLRQAFIVLHQWRQPRKANDVCDT